MAHYLDEGIALRTYKLGEADRIVTFLTPEHGKVRAVAKGVRKTKSRIGARVEPLSHVSMMCWKGRELDVVSQVEVLDHFRAIREDLDRLASAMTMLEIADHVSLEHHPSPELFALVLNALRELDRSNSPYLLGAFCFKLLALEGVAPSLEQCDRCGEDRELVAFDTTIGGFVCAGCRRGNSVSPEVLELVRAVFNGRLAAVLREPSHEHAGAFGHLATIAVERHLERRLRSTRQFLSEVGSTTGQ